MSLACGSTSMAGVWEGQYSVRTTSLWLVSTLTALPRACVRACVCVAQGQGSMSGVFLSGSHTFSEAGPLTDSGPQGLG